MGMPTHPQLYHIVHGDRLAAIIHEGGLLCDREMVNRQNVGTTIGMSNIKERRLQWHVPCHSGTVVGDYVPFYFCPRSVMLYVIHRKNMDPESESDLRYGGGQRPIVHLEADLGDVVAWATSTRRRWAFSTGNAAAVGVRFHADLDRLDQIDWDAVQARYWSEARELKQAEFLVYGFVPWRLVRRIGVLSQPVAKRVAEIVEHADYAPPVEVLRNWYY